MVYSQYMATPKDPKKKKLTPLQLKWCYHYAELGNGTEAAARAGYKGSRRTLSAIASENLTKPNILAKLEEIYSSYGMGAQETLGRLAKIARSFDPTEYVTEKEKYEFDDDGNPYFVGYVISADLDGLRRDGYASLIKKIKQNSKGGMEIEYHDPVRALEMMAKNHALLTDRILDDSKEKAFHVTIEKGKDD